MIKKQLYTIQTTLKSNMLLNYDRNNNLLANNQRLVNICNKLRDEDIIYIHLQTENFDKYFNTRFNNVQYLSGLLEDDDDDF
jgi:hypothetical protein